MGTNYYHRTNVGQKCPTCGHHKAEGDLRHIGKSSAGWVFMLHVYPDAGIYDLKDWTKLWEAGYIENEYGIRIPASEMYTIITGRVKGLLRTSGNDRRLFAYGVGTWDCITGDFS